MAGARGLKRVAALYGVMERMRLAEVRVATAGVDEVEQVSAMEESLRLREYAAGRSALRGGDRAGWMVADLSCDVAAVRVKRLAGVRDERVEALEDALMAHRASRLRLKQVEQVMEGVESEERVVEGRRTQGEADDRFSARRAWMRDRT